MKKRRLEEVNLNERIKTSKYSSNYTANSLQSKKQSIDNIDGINNLYTRGTKFTSTITTTAPFCNGQELQKKLQLSDRATFDANSCNTGTSASLYMPRIENTLNNVRKFTNSNSISNRLKTGGLRNLKLSNSSNANRIDRE